MNGHARSAFPRRHRVLLGVPAAVYRWRPRLPHPNLLVGATDMLYWFSLEIRDPRFSYEEIRELFGFLVEKGILTSTTSSAAQRDKFARLRAFVRERRDHRTPPMTWANIVAEWNATYPDEHYTLRTIQRAYAKACQMSGEPKPPVMRGRPRGQHRPNDPPR